GADVFRGACAACHTSEESGPKLYGAQPMLAVNSNLHSMRPDNLIQVILKGISEPANSELGYMPAFGETLTDEQIISLVDYMRQRYAPGKPAWKDVDAAVRKIRNLVP